MAADFSPNPARVAEIFGRSREEKAHQSRGEQEADALFLMQMGGFLIAGISGAAAASFVMGAVIGLGEGMLSALQAIGARAGAGPGICADPGRRPNGPTDSRWKHYGPPWVVQLSPPQNDFEANIQPLLIKIWESWNNCGPVENPLVLGNQLIQLWNDTHNGPSTTYPVVHEFGRPDPLVLGFPQPVNVNMGSLKPVANQVQINTANGQGFLVNGSSFGGVIGQTTPHPNTSPSPTSMSTGSKFLLGTVVAAGTIAGGTAIYAHYTRQSFTGLWKGLYRSAKRKI